MESTRKNNRQLFLDKEFLATLALAKEGVLHPVDKLMNSAEAKEVEHSGYYKGKPFPFPFIIAPAGEKNREVLTTSYKGEPLDFVVDGKIKGTIIVDEVFEVAGEYGIVPSLAVSESLGGAVFAGGRSLAGIFPLVDGGQAFALRGAIGVGGKPRYIGDRFVHIGGFGCKALTAFHPLLQIVAVGLLAAYFAALPLRIFLHKLGKFAVGYRRFIQFKRGHGNHGGVFFQIKRPIAAAADFGHIGGKGRAAEHQQAEGEQFGCVHGGCLYLYHQNVFQTAFLQKPCNTNSKK